MVQWLKAITRTRFALPELNDPLTSLNGRLECLAVSKNKTRGLSMNAILSRRFGYVRLLILGAICATTSIAQTGAGKQLNSALLSEFKWRLIGPSSPAGRAWTVVGDENNPKTFY